MKLTILMGCLAGVVMSLGVQAQDAESMMALLQKIEQAVERGQVEEARTLIDEARERGLSEEALARLRAGIMIKQGMLAEAQTFLTEHLTGHPEDIAARALLCNAYGDVKDPAERDAVIELLEQQVRIMTTQANRASYLALLSQGRLAMLKGELTGARLAFMKAKRAFPVPNPQLLRQLLQLDFMQNEQVSARINAEELIKLMPEEPFANFVLGSLALQREDWTLGVEYLERSVAANPTAGPLNDLAWGLIQLGRLEEAAAHIAKALELAPDLAAAMDTLGVIRLKQKRFEEAAAQFLKALAVEPGDVGVTLHLAQAYAAQGKMAEAKPLVDAVVRAIETLSPAQRAELRTLGEKVGVLVPEAR